MQHTWYLVRYLQAPKRLQIRGTGSVSRVKNPYEQGLPHYTYVLQAEQRLPHATEKATRSFPMERGPIAKHTLREIRSARSGLGQRSFRSSALNRKSCHACFSLGDAGAARWPLSHRWTDTSAILPDAEHDSRNQGRVVSLSVLSLLSACVLSLIHI